MSEAVAIIPARGGSKRIPGKNIRLFCGRPIIAYAIEAARRSGLFARILVSTDSDEIACIARAHGAETPFVRPAALADDVTTTAAVLAHALGALGAAAPAHACCLYATAAFVTPEDLSAGFELLRARPFSTVIGVTSFPAPIFRALRRTDNGQVKMIWPEHRDTRSNDLPEALHDAGQFYWVCVDDFLDQPVLFGERTGAVRLPRRRVYDIDTVEDWEWAEAAYRTTMAGRADADAPDRSRI